MNKRILIIICILASVSEIATGQSDAKQLEKEVKSDFGVDRLVTLNKLTALYLAKDIKKATKYGRQAVDLAENIFSDTNPLQDDEQRHLKAEAYNLLGKVYFFQEKYIDALPNFEKAKQEAGQLGLFDDEQEANMFLLKLDSLKNAGHDIEGGFLKNLKRKIKIGKKISSTSQDLSISAILKVAETYEKRENYTKAIENYQKAINQLANRGEAKRIAALHTKIADLYKKSGNYQESLAYYQLSIEENKKMGDSAQVQASEEELTGIFESIQSLKLKK